MPKKPLTKKDELIQNLRTGNGQLLNETLELQKELVQAGNELSALREENRRLQEVADRLRAGNAKTYAQYRDINAKLVSCGKSYDLQNIRLEAGLKVLKARDATIDELNARHEVLREELRQANNRLLIKSNLKLTGTKRDFFGLITTTKVYE